ncbi:hypothetical protein AAG570_011989 [Ranatra chinensis]|uniref:UDP-glycosyltransferases domain-containing protein n=1 Tax=Ranatra chinensis TaxID=642074 RepID=A0ABD0Z3T1_9HEMI
MPAKSHQAVFTPIIRELANRGHHVTAYVPYPMAKPPPTYKEIIVPNVMEDLFKQFDIMEMTKTNIALQAGSLFWMGFFLQETLCSTKVVQDLVQSKDLEFDAIILESFFVHEAFSALQHKFNAIPIEINPTGGLFMAYEMMGSPYNPSYMPYATLPYSDAMSFKERLVSSLLVTGVKGAFYGYYFPKLEALMKTCFNYEGAEARPSLVDLLGNKSLVLENSHFSIGYPSPVAPNVVNIGGINVHPPKALPADIKEYMDRAEHGVIYFSLGSNIKVSDVAKDKLLEAFISSFGKLKQRVLWKWEKDDFPNKPANVKTSKWFPQQDILAHKNCVLFVTHGGFLSLSEAVSRGVPLVAIPFFADQPKNAKYAADSGLGLRLDLDNITEASLTWAINEVLSNPSYSRAIKEKSKLFNDRPMTPLATAVYWIEYVIRNKGGSHMRPALSRLAWYQSTLTDVGVFITICALSALAMLCCTLKAVFRCICSKKSTKGQQSSKKQQKHKTSLVAALSLVAVEGARILAFFPFPSPSHQAVFQSIVRRLAERGHSVTFLSPRPLTDPPPNYKEILVRDTVQELFRRVDIIEFGKQGPFGELIILHEMGLYFQQKVCSEPQVRQLIHSDENFDAVILSSLFVQESFAALGHKFKASVIELLPLGSSHWVDAVVGSPYNPSYMPDFKCPFTDRMDFLERLYNSVVSLATVAAGSLYYMPKTQTLMDACFDYEGWKERPPLRDILAHKSLVLSNSHFSLNYAEPKAPHFVDIAGINIPNPKPLPKDLQTFMDGAKDGVIYFSLGSNIKVSSVAKDEVFRSFMAALSKVKQRVLWKWEIDDFPVKSPNIKISKWFPQADILAHKNCKLFITHGGYLSMNEAVNFGVPMIGIPFFGDQPKNLKHVTSLGYGVEIKFHNVSESSISWAINEVLSNPRYSENVKKRSEIFRDRPMRPLETAMYWIEYVIRHDGAHHLRPYLAHLPMYKSMLLDVAGTMITGVLVVVVLAYLMVRKLWCLLCSCGPKKTSELPKKKTQ